MKKLMFVFVLIGSFVFLSVQASNIAGIVVRISDGDTVVLKSAWIEESYIGIAQHDV